jgi:RNA polymerase sigma-70 factor (ECF subfamily)
MLAYATAPVDVVEDFEKLVLPLEKVLFARAVGLERSAHDALDLVQDTLERALRNFSQFQPGTNVKLWLFRIMYNLFVDRYRRRSHELGYESIDLYDLAAPEPDAPAEWEGVETREVLDALERLEPRFRAVLELHFTEKRSYRDISEQLGIPTGTVGTRLLRARQKIRHLLATPAKASPQGAVA